MGIEWWFGTDELESGLMREGTESGRIARWRGDGRENGCEMSAW
jgi:hypothetical protein